MKKVKYYGLALIIGATLALSGYSCSGDASEGQTARLSVRMADAPGNYDEVNVEVVDVQMKADAGSDDTGWVSVGSITPGIYNLLSLTGGSSILLADNEVPTIHLGQMRLLLGTHNTVKKGGIIYPLNTPSGQQSGLKLTINETLVAGVSYDYFLDFDVDHSVTRAGNSGNYNLHPVIHVSSTATSGVIKGTLGPAGFQVVASIDVDGLAVSTYADATGKYQFNGVPAGSYTVNFTPDSSSGHTALVVPNVVVVNGSANNMGTLVLP